MRAVDAKALFACCLFSAACEPVEQSCSIHSSSSALTNGQANATFLKLEDDEQNAVVSIALEFADPSFNERCSGVRVAPQVVLSAKHCLHGLEPALAIVGLGQSAADSDPIRARLVGTHPTLDLAVFFLDDFSDPVRASLPMAESLPRNFGASDRVQLGGFGIDSDGELGRRAFLVSAVASVDEEGILVSATGLGGACFGDSGGPLIVRAADGSARTLGVLSKGSNSCFGEDLYVRVDRLGAWVSQLVGAAALETTAAISHERLGITGRCFGSLAVWSDGGSLSSESCNADQTCGWDTKSSGYRCIKPEADACSGTSELGSCEGASAARCEFGSVILSPCGACGLRCGISPRNGYATCLSARAED